MAGDSIRARRYRVLVGRVVVAVGTIAAWEWLSRKGILDPFFFSQPSEIALRLTDWFGSGTVWTHLSATLTETLLALSIGGALGLLAGLALSRMPFAAAVVDPYVKVFNALPRVVLAPVFLLWFGLGIWSKVALGVTLVAVIVFYNTVHGIRDVDPDLVDNLRLLGAGEVQVMRLALLPSALTWIFAGLHVSVGFAVAGAVIGEYLGAARGVGYLIAQSEGTLDATGVFAGITVLGAAAVAIDFGVQRSERRLLRWKPAATTRER
ncbi:ABC transporter permease [Nocardia inohanensis]|uniref:ABC transporter permease n=1 Tax=Nocardia inohanensis TaxID=209246 RepID=UPI00082BD40C|nr:ABC transporter permease [Nocardia inohanensis]